MSILECDDSDVSRKILKLIADGRAALSIPRVADFLDCGPSSVYKLLSPGANGEPPQLRSFLISGKRRIAIEDLAELIAKKRAEPPQMRTMPWDRAGLAPRQRWPRRAAPREAEATIKGGDQPAVAKRGPGRPPRKNAGAR